MRIDGFIVCAETKDVPLRSQRLNWIRLEIPPEAQSPSAPRQRFSMGRAKPVWHLAKHDKQIPAQRALLMLDER
jgi:hypothetical protein